MGWDSNWSMVGEEVMWEGCGGGNRWWNID